MTDTTVPPLGLEATLAADVVPQMIERLSLPPEGATEERYDLVGLLGEGGMGEVHLGVDRRLGREVAYKLTKARGASSRFVREALLSARLEHPAIVPVYDVGSRKDRTLFFTMRRIRGETLEAVLKSERFTRHRLLGAFVQVCLAVDYAHSRGVVHRDLKPANIIFGDFGEVYVLDWGIAKIAAGTGERALLGSDEETQEGQLMGTLGYMAPEQLRGEHATLDGRADVYSLGAILFEILAHERMHLGETFAAIFESIKAAGPAHPAARATERDIPPELDAICAQATDPDRERRFDSARALGEAIERFLEGDRDAALRKRTAEGHAARATTALQSNDRGARVEAGREAARALAFDPANVEARRALLDVVASAPAHIPDEARRSAEQAQHAEYTTQNRWYANGLIVVCLMFTLGLGLSGIRDWPTFIAMLLTAALAVVFFQLGARISARRALLQTLGFVSIGATNVLLARWLGPWIAVPASMFVNTVAITFFGAQRHRTLHLAIAVVVVMLPPLLEELGAISASYTYGAERLVIHANVANLPPWLPWLLTMLTAVTLMIAVIWVGRMLDRLAALELRAHAQAWVLRQVITTD
jgi:hypothetical protein